MRQGCTPGTGHVGEDLGGCQMGTYIIIGTVFIACILAAYSYIRKLRRGDNCCTTGGDPVKRVRVADRNKGNYPYILELCISGMTCANCALRVENALNSLPDVWAQVDLGRKAALVRSKAPVNSDSLRQAVRQSGYIVTVIKDEAERIENKK